MGVNAGIRIRVRAGTEENRGWTRMDADEGGWMGDQRFKAVGCFYFSAAAKSGAVPPSSDPCQSAFICGKNFFIRHPSLIKKPKKTLRARGGEIE
jgi:hypothetical protein